MRISVFLVALSALRVGAAEAREAQPQPSQLLIAGFERPEVERLATPLAATLHDEKDVLGRPFVHVGMKGGRVTREWSLYAGDASQGR
jgi:hypothetical protein